MSLRAPLRKIKKRAFKCVDTDCTYLQLLHPHPKDDVMVRFRAEDHSYSIRAGLGGTWTSSNVLSVTGFLSTLGEPFPSFLAGVTCKSVNKRFHFWYANRHLYPDPRSDVAEFRGPIWPEKYLCHVPLAVFARILKGKSLDEVETPLPEPLGKYTAQDVSDAWSRAGTLLHANIERHLNMHPQPTPTAPEWPQVLRFFHDHRRVWRWFRTEMRVAIPDLRMCGTLDALARHEEDGRFILVDWKNSKKIKSSADLDEDFGEDKYLFPPLDFIADTSRNKYFFQAALYKLALEQEYGIQIAEMYIVVFHYSNEDYIKIRVPDMDSDPELLGAFRAKLQERRDFVQKLLREEEEAQNSEGPDQDEIDAALEAHPHLDRNDFKILRILK